MSQALDVRLTEQVIIMTVHCHTCVLLPGFVHTLQAASHFLPPSSKLLTT